MHYVAWEKMRLKKNVLLTQLSQGVGRLRPCLGRLSMPGRVGSHRVCLASPANFIYGRVLAKVLSHVTIMPVLLRPVNNFLGQVIGNASEGKYNTVNNSSSGEVTFQKCLKSGITLFSSKNSNKSQTFATGAYQRLHEARPRRVVWLLEPE